MIRSNHFTENFIILLIISSIFLPTIPLVLDIRVDDLMVFFFIPLFLLVRPNFKVNRLLLSYLLILILFTVSTIYGYFFLNVPASLRDLNELIRIIKPFLIIIAVSYCDSNKLALKLNAVFKYGAILIILIGFLEFFDFLGCRSFLTKIYGNDLHNADISGRIVLTVSNPNIAAALVIYFITYVLQSMLITKYKILDSIVLLLLMIVLLMTSSRTSLVVFIIILFSSLFFHFKKNKVLTLMILTLSFTLLITMIQFFDYLVIGFSTFSEGKNTSMLLRYQQWTDAYVLFLQSPIIGWGPAKAIHTTIVDSEHLLLLRRYGVLGYLAVLNFIFGYVWVLYNKRKKFKQMDFLHKRIAITSLFSCLMIFIIMITNNFFSGYQLITLFVVMITLVENKLSKI